MEDDDSNSNQNIGFYTDYLCFVGGGGYGR